MKKILIYFLAFLVILAPVESFARTRLLSSAPVYKGTITGLRISAVDGTAFIDNANASVTALADGNHTIEIYDSAGRMLKGVLKAAGTSETLGSDLLSGLDFTSGWIAAAATITGANTFTMTASSGGVYKAILVAGGLYKSSLSASASVGSISLATHGAKYTLCSNGSSDYYATNRTDSVIAYFIVVASSAGATAEVTTAISQQVLTPSTSGATIVSTKGGEVYNFTSKNSAFTYNASSYYVIIR